MLNRVPHRIMHWDWNRNRRSFKAQLQDAVATSLSYDYNPCRRRMPQISRPEGTRSLPNRNLNLSYENLVVETPSYLRRVRRLEKQGERLNQIRSGLLDRGPLARNVEFRAQCDKAIVFPFR